jgi:hypothetical protein
MRFTIDIQFRPDGRFEASCPEMGLAAVAGSIDEVFDKIKNLLLFQMMNVEDAGMSAVDEEQVTKQVELIFKDKNFCLPRNPKVH